MAVHRVCDTIELDFRHFYRCLYQRVSYLQPDNSISHIVSSQRFLILSLMFKCTSRTIRLVEFSPGACRACHYCNRRVLPPDQFSTESDIIIDFLHTKLDWKQLQPNVVLENAASQSIRLVPCVASRSGFFWESAVLTIGFSFIC